MTLENRAARLEDGSRTPSALTTKNSDSAPDVTVVTLRGILKFTLFFMACLVFALLLVAWYLGYFGRAIPR
jgi:predicted membrane protein